MGDGGFGRGVEIWWGVSGSMTTLAGIILRKYRPHVLNRTAICYDHMTSGPEPSDMVILLMSPHENRYRALYSQYIYFIAPN